MLLQILVLLDEGTSDDVDDDVGFADVDQHVVFENNRLLLSDEDSIAHTQVLDEIGRRIDIVLDLEVTATMLLCSLLVFVGDDEVVDDAFLEKVRRAKVS